MSDTLAESVSKTAELEPSQTPFTLWTVVKRVGLPTVGSSKVAAFDELIGRLAAQGVTLRGAYDVSAMRNDADVMLWLVGAKAEELQQAIRDIRRSELFANTEIAWSGMGCTERPNSPKATSLLICEPVLSQSNGSASTPSCAPTSGTSCRTKSAVGCCASTV